MNAPDTQAAQPMTTRQKIDLLIQAVRETPKDDYSGDLARLVEFADMATGLLHFDPMEALLPDSDAELDVFIDKTIALLLEIRGDDLPPFDAARVELGS